MDADEAIERAVALATTLGGDGGGDDVDMRLVGQLLADCKDARTEARGAWSLYQAAVVAGTAAEFNIRQYNFAPGRCSTAPRGGTRRPPHARDCRSRPRVTLSQLAHGLCKGAKDVLSMPPRQSASRGPR